MDNVYKSAYQYRLWLTKGQKRLLEQQLELCRWVYNQTLATRRDAWEQRQESLGLYDTIKLLPEWKADRPSLKQVHSQVLQNVQVRVDLAFKAFFRRVKAGEQESGLSIRVHSCPVCGLQIDRDLNAAIHILAVGRHSLGVSP